MIIQGNTVVVYDIEVFPNVFSCTCKNTETEELRVFEISERENQLENLVDFFRSNRDILFCGYNNHHYDDVIISYIIDYYNTLRFLPYYKVCQSLFNLSRAIVDAEEGSKRFNRWKYAKYFRSMDLLTMLFSSKLRVGLKEMQATMHYPNVQEYEGDFDTFLPAKEVDNMLKYNKNDVESTEALLNRLSNQIELRKFIQTEYGINALSMDSVKFGETLLLKEYCKFTGYSEKYVETLRSPMDYVPLKDVILPFIQFKNPILQDVLDDMKAQVVYTKERKSYEKKFVLSNVEYSVGVGGIHSIHSPEIFIPNKDEYIGHSDVASMYPSFIVQYHWVPRHLGDAFWKIYSRIYYERIEAKHSGQKSKSDALKLTLNSVSGKMQQETSWMYDPFTVFKIRINGQLVLLTIVDRLLELGCKIVQVNTDGVMYIAKKALRDRVQEAISEVEQLTHLTFETDSYEAFYQYAINDYFGIVEGYSQSKNPKLIEKKGMFITETNLGKGLAPTVIPEAVINYFLTKESVKDYIRRQTDIKKFLIGQRAGKKFKIHHGDNYVQRINRYYASTNGAYLFKEDDEGKEANMLTKSGVTILNKLDDTPIECRHINYTYYISEAKKIVDDFECKQLELF